jgi:dUTPase
MLEPLKFVKFFDIKSPVGIEQNEKEQFTEYHSIGVDIYMPRPTKEFVDAILESNKNLNLRLGEIPGKEFDSTLFSIYLDTNDDVYNFLEFKNNKYFIYHDIQIPTGLGLLIPKEYYVTVNSKSSNFAMGYSVVEGFIDCNYTYGMSVQIKKSINYNPIELEPNQKFAQLILKKSEFVNTMNEMKMDEWNIHPEVIKRREIRIGGFGSTGKY